MSRPEEVATPEDYRTVFELHPRGKVVLEDLIKRFGNAVYVKGGHEAERETTYRAGRRSVLDFMLGRINLANGVDDVSNDDESGEQPLL